jgi:hypothetical protein
VVLLLIALAALAAVHLSQHSTEPHTLRLQFPLPDKMKMDSFDYPVVSPDGQRVLLPGFAADGDRHLWLRSLDSLADQLLPGTEDVHWPFWSPDSRSVAFFCWRQAQLTWHDRDGALQGLIGEPRAYTILCYRRMKGDWL